jgi:dTDP-4-amino-4,6-dideoxygalactose transaminase
MNHNAIPKGAVEPRRFQQQCLFYRSAREGFADLLAYMPGNGAAGIALPAFIGWSPREGSGVFDPVRGSSAAACFYDLNADLTVDLGSLEKALNTHACRLLVVLHYFGRTEPHMAQVRQIASRHDVILVEDLAHGFYSWAVGGAAGRWGEAALFSLHKMLPRADGGMMLYRDREAIRGQRETAPELARFILDYDWHAIATARRANFQAVLQRLQGSSQEGHGFRLLWSDLAPSDVPQTLPVQILTGDRDAIYHRMNAEGFGMTSLYHTLIEEVREDFPEMVELSRSIINFPVHQDVDPDAILAMVQAFEAALDGSPAL